MPIEYYEMWKFIVMMIAILYIAMQLLIES